MKTSLKVGTKIFKVNYLNSRLILKEDCRILRGLNEISRSVNATKLKRLYCKLERKIGVLSKPSACTHKPN